MPYHPKAVAASRLPLLQDAASEKAQLTEACLDQNVLRQADVPGAQAPGDPFYHLGQIGNAYTYRLRYQLPQVGAGGAWQRGAAASWQRPSRLLLLHRGLHAAAAG